MTINTSHQPNNSRIETQYKIPYILGALFFFILGVVLSNTYRPYIYTNHLYDYHFADTIGNWVAVPSLTLLVVGMNKYTPYKATLYSVMVWFLYEIIPFGVFDYYDLLATLASGTLTYLAFYFFKSSGKH